MPQATFTFSTRILVGHRHRCPPGGGNNTNNNWSALGRNPRKDHRRRAISARHVIGGADAGRKTLNAPLDSGQNAHRFSVEWSRIQPTADTWDDKALERYVEIVRWMDNHNMTPMVTLHHFTDPLWLVDQGGWEKPRNPRLVCTLSPAGWWTP